MRIASIIQHRIARAANINGTYSLRSKDDTAAQEKAVRFANTSYFGAINFLLITCAKAIKTPQPKVIDSSSDIISKVYQIGMAEFDPILGNQTTVRSNF